VPAANDFDTTESRDGVSDINTGVDARVTMSLAVDVAAADAYYRDGM
jgi:hypothetical protein